LEVKKKLCLFVSVKRVGQVSDEAIFRSWFDHPSLVNDRREGGLESGIKVGIYIKEIMKG
jgi:hypothetical protein